MTGRREFITGTGVVAIVSLAGCADARELATDEEIERSADPSEPDDRTVDETGYEQVRSETVVIEEEFDVAGQHREFTANTEVRAYLNELEVELDGDAQSVFAVVSTPGVSAAGQQLSPLARMDETELIEEARGELSTEIAGEIRDPRKIEEIEHSIYGGTVDVSVYESTLLFDDGRELDGYVHVAIVERGDDVVLVTGVYPAAVADEERANMRALFESLD
ncbi:DUF6517 family protein [Halorubrum sp. DTA98]|uniref:DUF6517 family protein n=1 Tax=Halorubrum sp. DTA98 TaxID=3402163 RepID=UPI003AAE331D